MTPSWYDVLVVEEDATAAEIRAAWQESVAGLDPTDRRFKQRNRAAEVLLDPAKRAAHDLDLAAQDADDEADDGAAAGATGAADGVTTSATPTATKPVRTRPERPNRLTKPTAATAATTSTSVPGTVWCPRTVRHPVVSLPVAALATLLSTTIGVAAVVVSRLRPSSLPILVVASSAASGSRREDIPAISVVSAAALLTQTVLGFSRSGCLVHLHHLVLDHWDRLFDWWFHGSRGHAAVLVVHVQKSAVGLS